MRQVVVNDLVFGSGRMKISKSGEKTTEAVLDAVASQDHPGGFIEWRTIILTRTCSRPRRKFLKRLRWVHPCCAHSVQKRRVAKKEIRSHGPFCDERAAERLGCAACRFRAFSFASSTMTLQRRPFRLCTIWVRSLLSRTTILPKRLHARKSPTAISVAMALNADLPKIAVMPQNERDVMVMLAAMNESTGDLRRPSASTWASSQGMIACAAGCSARMTFASKESLRTGQPMQRLYLKC